MSLSTAHVISPLRRGEHSDCLTRHAKKSSGSTSRMSRANLNCWGMSKKRMGTIKLKRVYEPPAKTDGFRILVDRLWPRGVSKSAARINLWLKEIAPSDALRKWFGHDPSKWTEFRKRYFRELQRRPEAVAQVKQHVGNEVTTLVYGAKDERHNNAVALKEYLESG